jgi:hypothetical protein
VNPYTLLPAAWRPYAKTVVAVLGTVLSVLALSLPQVPAWVPITLNVLTALGVWGVANQTPAEEVAETGTVRPTG